MRTRSAISILAATLWLATSGFGQGGAGGYGQGSAAGYGQAGGMGGGGVAGGGRFNNEMNAPGPLDRFARPDDDDQEGLWGSKSAILTPGNKVEFKIAMKKGQTLLASVTSDAFDPGLSIQDGDKELCSNDDRVEGDQSPFIVYRFAADGTYKVTVKSFHSIAGGKFTIKMRTFFAEDAPIGGADHRHVILSGENANGPAVFRLSAKKSKVYDLSSIKSLNRFGTPFVIRQIIGPTGVRESDFLPIPTPDGSPVFQALTDGDYYLEFTTYGTDAIRTDFKEVATVSLKDTDEVKLDFAPQELKLIEFPVHKDQIVRTQIDGKSLAQTMSAPKAEPVGIDGSQSYGNDKHWAWFRMNRNSSADTVRVFHCEGDVGLAIRSVYGSNQKVTVSNSESLPDWATGLPLKESINIGDSKLFLIKSTKSELMRVAATASHFEPKLEIFRMSGDLANSLMNRQTHVAGDDLYFPDAGAFVVRLSCDGDGGSGDFELKRQSLPAAPYALGKVETLKLDGENFGIYSMNLEKGKRYVLTTDQPSKFLRADLLDEDGQFLVSRAIAFDNVEVQYFVPTRSGMHRLWLRGEPAEHRFRFEVHVPPTLGK